MKKGLNQQRIKKGNKIMRLGINKKVFNQKAGFKPKFK